MPWSRKPSRKGDERAISSRDDAWRNAGEEGGGDYHGHERREPSTHMNRACAHPPTDLGDTGRVDPVGLKERQPHLLCQASRSGRRPRGGFGIVGPHLLEETSAVLVPNEHLELDGDVEAACRSDDGNDTASFRERELL